MSHCELFETCACLLCRPQVIALHEILQGYSIFLSKNLLEEQTVKCALKKNSLNNFSLLIVSFLLTPNGSPSFYNLLPKAAAASYQCDPIREESSFKASEVDAHEVWLFTLLQVFMLFYFLRITIKNFEAGMNMKH